MNTSTSQIRHEATLLFRLNETTLFPQLKQSRSSRHRNRYIKSFNIDVQESESKRKDANQLYKIVQTLFYEPFTLSINENLDIPVTYLTTSNEFKLLSSSQINKHFLSRQFMKKQPGFHRKSLINYQIRHSEHFKESSYALFIDGVLSMVHLKQILSPEAVAGKHAIASLESFVDLFNEGGSMKGCPPDGKLTFPKIASQLKNARNVRKWGCKDQHQVVTVRASSTGNSGRMVYRNNQEEMNSFQISTHLQRHDRKASNSAIRGYYSKRCSTISHDEWKPYINTYVQEVEQASNRYLPAFLDYETNKEFKSRPQFPTLLESMDWSVNHLNQYTSRIHIHRDPATRLPTILGVINPLKNQKDWTGGELCLPQVGFVVNYEEADIVILKGSVIWHCVLPMSPIHSQQSQNGQLYRTSIVHYNNNW